MVAELVGGIRSSIRWALLKGLFFLSPRVSLDGLEIVDVAEEDSARMLECLREALRVLERNDPRRYRRLKRDVRRIVVMKVGQPEYAAEVGACLLRSRYVREGGAAEVATTLVHEATHARLSSFGIGYGRTLRARVEAICVKEQIAFAERLGNVDILTHLRGKLQTPWWEPAQLHDRRVAALRELGVPEWALRGYERLVCANRRIHRPTKSPES